MGLLSRIGFRLAESRNKDPIAALATWRVDLEAAVARLRVSTNTPARPPRTTDYTITSDDELVLVDATGGNVNITLPAISDEMVLGEYQVTVKKVSTFGDVLLTPTGDTIDGYTGVAITALNTALHLRATPEGWKIT